MGLSVPDTRQHKIRTVLGDVIANDLGRVNSHAHLIHDFRPWGDDRYADYWFNEEDSRRELAHLTEGRDDAPAIVELTPMGVGRAPLVLRRLASDSGVAVIAGSGLYHEPFHPKTTATWGPEEYHEHFVTEMTVGMGGTDVLAGLIGEIGTYTGPPTRQERAVFIGAGRASRDLGSAVSTHTYLGRYAAQQIEILAEAGADPRKIIVGHLDDKSPLDLDICRSVCQYGANVEFDGLGCEYFSTTLNAQSPTDRERISGLLTLADEGYAEQIVLGSDMCRRFHLKVEGGPGLGHLPHVFPDIARECGVPMDLLDSWLRTNALRILSLENV